MKKGKGLLLAALLLTAGPVRAQVFPGSTADDWRGPWPPPLPNMAGRPGLLGRPGPPGRPNPVLPGGAAALWGPAPGPLSGVPGGPGGAAPPVSPEILQMLQPPSISPNLLTVPPVQPPPALPPPARPPLAAAPQGPPREFRGGYALVVAGAAVAAALLYGLLRRKPAA